MCLNIFKKPTPEPISDEYLSGEEIFYTAESIYKQCATFIGDKVYEAITVDQLKEFLKEDNTDKKVYCSDSYDCDEFSAILYGRVNEGIYSWIPFGIVWLEKDNGSLHAMNIFIDINRDVWLIEPQDDKVFIFPENWKPMVIII